LTLSNRSDLPLSFRERQRVNSALGSHLAHLADGGDRLLEKRSHVIDGLGRTDLSVIWSSWESASRAECEASATEGPVHLLRLRPHPRSSVGEVEALRRRL